MQFIYVNTSNWVYLLVKHFKSLADEDDKKDCALFTKKRKLVKNLSFFSNQK